MYINVTKNATGLGYKYPDLLSVAKAVEDAGIEARQHTIWSAEADGWVVETKVKFPGEDKFGDWDSPVPIIAGAKMSRQGKRILSDMQEYGIKFSVNAETQTRAFFKRLCEEFGGDEVIESWDIACEQYPDPVTALTKLKGILYNRRRFYSFIEED